MNRVALITDGRFSGATKGGSVGHVSPEAAAGGPIALVRPGDMIEIDIPAANSACSSRTRNWPSVRPDGSGPRPKIDYGYLARYAAAVTSADTGAVLRQPEL